jgi:hypothetical protein
MDIIDIIILVVLLLLFWKFGVPLLIQGKTSEQFSYTGQNNRDNRDDKNNNNHRRSDRRDKNNKNDKNDDYENPAKYIDIILNSKNKGSNIKVNPHYVEAMWHTDYRDVQNSFELITPNKKQLFNLCALPVDQVSEVPITDTRYLVTKFIKEVNKTVKNKVSDTLSANTWIDNMPQERVKSGWDKQQEALGLPTSIYNEPAKKAPIKLVKIDHAEKYETEKEIRYSLFLIIQKTNAKDQLVVKINFVVDKTDANLDRDFFSTTKNSFKTTVLIEEISIIGYLTLNDFGERTPKDDFYQFDAITDGKMFSQEQIIKELNKKKSEYAAEMCQT